MSAASDFSERAVGFPDLPRWHEFLRAHRVARSFDRPDLPAVAQPVQAWTIWRRATLISVACLFPLSRETGVWVRHDMRGQGLAHRALAGVLADGTPPVFAQVGRDTPDAQAMRRVLTKAGFLVLARHDGHDVWILRAAVLLGPR